MSKEKIDVLIDMISKNIDSDKNKFDLLMNSIENYIEGSRAVKVINVFTELPDKEEIRKKRLEYLPHD